MIAPRNAYPFVVTAIAAALVILAFRRPNRATIPIAVAVMSTAAATAIWAGQLVFPLVYYIARLRSEYHLRLALLFAMIISPPILYWRMPWPGPMPTGPTTHAVANVSNLRIVTYVGGGNRTKGQRLPVPFQIASIAFTPTGSRTPLTATDTVDSGSVPTLRKRGKLDVIYSPFDPAGARVAGATRTYAAALWRYVMELMYGVTAVVAVIVEAMLVTRRVFRGRSRVRRATAMREGISRQLGR